MNKKRIILLITIAAIFGCLAFVLDRFLSVSIMFLGVKDGFKITFYPLILILISIIISPISGTLSGLIAAILSQLIFPTWGITPTTILWMIPYIVWGVLPGLLYKLFNKKLISLIISILITCITVSLLNSIILFFDGLINNYAVEMSLLLISVRLLTSIIISIIYIPVTILLKKYIKL